MRGAAPIAETLPKEIRPFSSFSLAQHTLYAADTDTTTIFIDSDGNETKDAAIRIDGRVDLAFDNGIISIL